MSTTHLHIGLTDQGRKMTLEEFREAEEQPGYLYELARGVLEATNVPNDDHGQIVDNIHELFSTFRRDHPGLILRIGHGSDVRLIIPELESDRHPDLAIVFRNAPVNPEGHRVPALVVEVVSPGNRSRERDYEAKREEYLALGIEEYWIVDPQRRQVMVLNRQPDCPVWEERVYQGAETLASLILPGFAVPITEFWADLPSND